jgi:hypothetical protein
MATYIALNCFRKKDFGNNISIRKQFESMCKLKQVDQETQLNFTLTGRH